MAIVLILANILIWLLTLGDDAIYLTFGFVPANANIFALFTSMFLHAGIWHLGGNMYFLGVFGNIIETEWGTKKFIALYAGGGLLASLAHWAVFSDSPVPLIGASGAIAALMGAVAVAFPSEKVNLFGFLGPLFAFGQRNVDAPAGVVLLLWFLYQWWMFLGPAETQGVAWAVHVIGFIAGAATAARHRKQHTITEDEW